MDNGPGWASLARAIGGMVEGVQSRELCAHGNGLGGWDSGTRIRTRSSREVGGVWVGKRREKAKTNGRNGRRRKCDCSCQLQLQDDQGDSLHAAAGTVQPETPIDAEAPLILMRIEMVSRCLNRQTKSQRGGLPGAFSWLGVLTQPLRTNPFYDLGGMQLARLGAAKPSPSSPPPAAVWRCGFGEIQREIRCKVP